MEYKETILEYEQRVIELKQDQSALLAKIQMDKEKSPPKRSSNNLNSFIAGTQM